MASQPETEKSPPKYRQLTLPRAFGNTLDEFAAWLEPMGFSSPVQVVTAGVRELMDKYDWHPGKPPIVDEDLFRPFPSRRPPE